MSIDAKALTATVELELTQVSDARVTAQVHKLLVEPTITMRRWDYGREGEKYPCWTVLRHPSSNTGIAYSEHGFGPRSPWGLVFLEGDESRTSIGMDCSWYTTFLQAFFESAAATDLPIWRVFKTDPHTGQVEPLTEEGEWDATWAQVTSLREADPGSRYHCWTSIKY